MALPCPSTPQRTDVRVTNTSRRKNPWPKGNAPPMRAL
eukprot:CAMPEP_0170189428 /NCGR_PEP_ID=MMETSP0040_2-20121228/46837_1 /TAXON_ID=641309 /ORGANISM="Lotharella oceanica, Strain CCMP622" /LENGTH=37 /DNA_ID= /DNA_START= /DNA_END= /DNA_ORIENTATION=